MCMRWRLVDGFEVELASGNACQKHTNPMILVQLAGPRDASNVDMAKLPRTAELNSNGSPHKGSQRFWGLGCCSTHGVPEQAKWSEYKSHTTATTQWNNLGQPTTTRQDFKKLCALQPANKQSWKHHTRCHPDPVGICFSAPKEASVVDALLKAKPKPPNPK